MIGCQSAYAQLSQAHWFKPKPIYALIFSEQRNPRNRQVFREILKNLLLEYCIKL